MAEHKNITDPNNHEPKGASTALIDTVYFSDGAGSGTWKEPSFDPNTIQIERVLDALSLASSQQPSVVDTPVQLEFGAAQFGPSDPVQISTLGLVTINETGTYRIKISLAVGRTGSTGVSELYARALVNGTGAGQSIHFKIGSADSYIAYSDEAWLTLPAGTEITYEIMRDSSGNNSGGVFEGNPTPAGWANNPSAALRIERWT